MLDPNLLRNEPDAVAEKLARRGFKLDETSIEQICLIAEEEQPKLMVIDSIQVMHMADIQSSPGSVAQV
ncbi:hypothetical protein ONQ97_26660, partial [Salmonella enterica subsp. enterica serovar Virginia]|nr:hypothetical protein [Salmonella enterica subsp. enterica serovar Virginia]